MGDPGTIGERWTDTFGVPCPTLADMGRARQSETARHEVDDAYVRWLGLPADEVGPFLRRLREFDMRTEAAEMNAAADAVERARARLRTVQGVVPPRIDAPRITAPRLRAPRAA